MGAKRAKPKRRFPGIQARYLAGRGWCWRGRIVTDGEQIVGDYHAGPEGQERAHDDYREMRTRHRALPSGPLLTVAEAIVVVTERARRRGVKEITIKNQFGPHGRYLLRFFDADMAVAEIGEATAQSFVDWSRRKGRHPNTTLQKDLPLLYQLGEAAGHVIPKPKSLPRYQKPDMDFVPWVELRKILAAIRNSDQKKFRSCVRHADLMTILACTGIRSGEMGRIRAGDVHWGKRTIRVQSKDRSNPRSQPFGEELEPVLKRCFGVADEAQPLLPRGRAGYLNTMFARWTERLKDDLDRIGCRQFGGRTLRHSYCTHLLEIGTPVNRVRELMGHQTLAMMPRYMHALDETKREAADNIASDLLTTPESDASSPASDDPEPDPS